ncbi:hypothetical protein [Sphingomicrobium lutaoense]|uniref:Putative membrane protein n=1 Tax=Sphingomicrobium lutaoense TaxID=515949 RepID=A0A839YVF0_9SPHN|nr:hypothetical protein [Sphingomicrobium lutaoense]MBB3763016.1 putative membrane protein [Sphingomicrobium lutaoense]
MSSSGLYFIGFLIVIAGLAYGAMMLGVPPVWIGIGAAILVGFGLMSTITNTKRREPPAGEETRTTTTTTVREE